ncbi:MAG: hypothetical protein ACRD03_04025 [Acidimicrobiales bacterium]
MTPSQGLFETPTSSRATAHAQHARSGCVYRTSVDGASRFLGSLWFFGQTRHEGLDLGGRQRVGDRRVPAQPLEARLLVWRQRHVVVGRDEAGVVEVVRHGDQVGALQRDARRQQGTARPVEGGGREDLRLRLPVGVGPVEHPGEGEHGGLLGLDG